MTTLPDIGQPVNAEDSYLRTDEKPLEPRTLRYLFCLPGNDMNKNFEVAAHKGCPLANPEQPAVRHKRTHPVLLVVAGVLALPALLTGSAQAVEQVYVEGGTLLNPAGKSFPDDVEAGLGWSLPWQWFGGSLTSRLNIGIGYIDGKANGSWRALAIPMLRYQMGSGSRGAFAELGIGVTYLSNTRLAPDHDMSSHLQFIDRLGIGYRFDDNELSLNLTHISNAGLEQPNPGAETVSLRYSRRF